MLSIGSILMCGDIMVKKGVPKRDGSGRGVRANRGRGGCSNTKKTGKRRFGGFRRRRRIRR